MSRLRLFVALALTVLALPGTAAAQAQDITADPTSLLWGRQFTEWFYGAEADSIFARMDAENQKEAGSAARILEFLSRVQTQGGTEDEILSEEVQPDSAGAGHRYIRRARFSNLPTMVIRIVWTLGPEKKITGFGMRPEEQGDN